MGRVRPWENPMGEDMTLLLHPHYPFIPGIAILSVYNSSILIM